MLTGEDIGPVPAYYAAVRLAMCGTARPYPNPNVDLLPFKLKIGTPVTPVQGNLHANFSFLCAFLFAI